MTQSYCHHRVLLEPDQETIGKILETKTMSKKFDLKGLILDYFDISSEASKIYTKLLKSIFQIQSNYPSIEQILYIVIEDYPPQSDAATCGLVEVVAMALAHPNCTCHGSIVLQLTLEAIYEETWKPSAFEKQATEENWRST
ncbi:hypothetical protein L6452_09595 [Arctium lappa]|uniref:Uncharacterized protein n=1 Tax=Arctium lappa TaxID=4217 RepID=A0ACB9DKZ2_ARCLA|nr:hypothetical protein L6452_09595 [Arctium lappa]